VLILASPDLKKITCVIEKGYLTKWKLVTKTKVAERLPLPDLTVIISNNADIDNSFVDSRTVYYLSFSTNTIRLGGLCDKREPLGLTQEAPV